LAKAKGEFMTETRTRSSVKLVLFLMAAPLLVFGQVGNGTITGVVTDSSGAIVAGTTVEARNTETGVVFRGVSTNAGEYTIADLPVGTYAVSVTATGFKTYTHPNLALAATQVLREDIVLQVGAASESVTVTTEASLLTTESAELSRNVTNEALDALPLIGIGTVDAGTSGFRNPFNSLLTLPGITSYDASGLFTLNGLPGSGALSETMRIEGQDATSRMFPSSGGNGGLGDYAQTIQPSVDAIQEMSYQTSNYAPENGQSGIVVINMTMRSGTNQYHGSAYDYFVNEDLAAGDPFSRSGGCIVGPTGQACSAVGGDGGKFRPRARRNDFGGTLGGPLVIPKLYNGHNKTFWFYNYEQFNEVTVYSFNDTVPTANFLQGNFSQISPNGTCSACAQLGIQTTALGTPTTQLDPVGSPQFANEIFDPATRAVATSGPLTGQGYAQPFPNNVIPMTRFDPVSVKLLSYMPSANNSNFAGNYGVTEPGNRYSSIQTVKVDENIDVKDKITFYNSLLTTQNLINNTLGSADGLPNQITAARGTFVWGYTERLNYDRTLRPDLLLHLGAGYIDSTFNDANWWGRSGNYFNPSSALGLSGISNQQPFPTFTGLYNTSYGGMQQMGPNSAVGKDFDEKPTGIANMTWVHGRHTFKIGAELDLIQFIAKNPAYAVFAGGTAATSEPFTPVNSFGSFSTGFGFASFLLGDYNGITQNAFTEVREGHQEWALFIQDSWKVTRKLTLDYGLRWDYDTAEHDTYGRLGQLDATLPNPNAGGRLGALDFASTCRCSFYKSAYPYALGPRLGVAYQITPKTVFRGGWGYIYNFVNNPAGGIVSTQGVYNLAANSPSYVPSAYQFVNIEAPGAIQTPAWPVTNPYQYPNPGSTSPAPVVPDGNENRPPRINQFSAGFQRQIFANLVMEASYIGNRGVWLGSGVAGTLGRLSQLSPQLLASYGLYPIPGTGPAGYNNENARALLADPLSSPQVTQFLASQGITNFLPYSGFPTSSSLQSALYPYPQFGNLADSYSPTGNTKYDSLQVKLTKRFSHHLVANGNYTWGQGFTRATRQDFFNPQSGRWALQQIPLQALSFNITYTTPKASFLPKYVNVLTNDWALGWFSNYQSGAFLTPPTSTVNPNYFTSEDVRVPGQPLYTPGVNINNHSTFSPYYTQVLNPAAWAPCPSNATCMSSGNPTTNAGGNLIKAFRAPRTPVENANIARNFRIKERMNLQIRGEFINVLNRLIMPAPTTTNPQAPVTKNALGIQTGGFGVINTYLAPNTGYALPAFANQPIMEPRQGTLIARFTF
jgi:Carboxypeptidase regulatory-like domain